MSNKDSKSGINKSEEQAPPSYPNYPSPYMYDPQEEETNLLDYWRILVENRLLLGATTAIGTAIALLIALVSTPIYRAEILLVPVTEQKSTGLAAIASQYGSLAELAGINLGGDGNTEESIATLKSRKLAVEFIKREQLMPVFFPDKWDTNNKQWKTPDEQPTYWQAYKLFDSHVRSIGTDRKSGLVTLAVEWKDPNLAATWANKLVELVNEDQRKEAIEQAERSIAFLEKQLATTGVVEVQQAIYKLIEAQTKNKMVANTRTEYAFRVIDPAVAPEQKVRPKRKQIVILGLMIGSMAGIFMAFFRKYLENQRKKEGIEKK
jgi:uncharacterized protein involved in exopolysaccharide biosynthesis